MIFYINVYQSDVLYRYAMLELYAFDYLASCVGRQMISYLQDKYIYYVMYILKESF